MLIVYYLDKDIFQVLKAYYLSDKDFKIVNNIIIVSINLIKRIALENDYIGL